MDSSESIGVSPSSPPNSSAWAGREAALRTDLKTVNVDKGEAKCRTTPPDEEVKDTLLLFFLDVKRCFIIIDWPGTGTSVKKVKKENGCAHPQ